MNRPKTTKLAAIYPDQTTSEAFKAILKHNFNYMLSWEPLAYDGEDIEGVHQVRVAFRRMRSALTVFRPAVPREVSARWADEMRWAAGELGPARDLDVFIDEGLGEISGKISQISGEEKMRAVAEEQKIKAYEQVRAMMDSERYANFKKEFMAWVDTSAWERETLPEKQAKMLQKNVTVFAVKVLDKRERKMLTDGAHIDILSTEELHQLRIDGKKLRYTAEFFLPLYKNKMNDFIAHLKRLQDLLGIMNDVTVMEGLLEHLLTGVEDSEIVQYAGVLIGWRARQYEEIKDQLANRWNLFIASGRPWLVEG